MRRRERFTAESRDGSLFAFESDDAMSWEPLERRTWGEQIDRMGGKRPAQNQTSAGGSSERVRSEHRVRSHSLSLLSVCTLQSCLKEGIPVLRFSLSYMSQL